MSDMNNVCRDCENNVRADYKYCPYCGNNLKTHLSKYKSVNISVLVGNGFDIAIMKEFNKSGRMKDKLPTYNEFYNYISYYADSRVLESNSLYNRMKIDLKEKKENWSDFELIIDSMVEKVVDFDSLSKDLDLFRDLFYRFLSDILSRQIMIDLNERSMSNKLAMQSMAYFLGDLGGKVNGINHRINHYSKLVYRFFNFNYTMLLDNYLCLDQNQFDPAKYKYSDMNLDFRPAPVTEDTNRGQINKYTGCSTYLMSDIFHVHGFYNIPRSILFGTEVPDLNPHNQEDKRKYFCKSHWARDELKYRDAIDKTDIFIVYGMAISKTDSWWFDKVYNRLRLGNAEMIIYYYDAFPETENRDDKEMIIKNRFMESCRGIIDSENTDVLNRIHIVLMKDNNTFFLGLKMRDEVRNTIS